LNVDECFDARFKVEKKGIVVGLTISASGTALALNF